jgi:hypothetical protein
MVSHGWYCVTPYQRIDRQTVGFIDKQWIDFDFLQVIFRILYKMA